MKALPWILVVLLTLAVLFLWNRQSKASTPDLVPDTTEYVDTIPYYKPIPKDSLVIRYETAKLPIKKDSCQSEKDTCSPDSVDVVIPITQKEYKDSLYRAWISGYHVTLDSIKVNSRVKEIRIPVPGKRKRWGIGLQAGYGYPGGVYVGVGVTYNIFQW